MNQPFIPLAKPILGPLEKKLVNDCLDTNWISSIGKYVEQFGGDLAKYTGAKYALPVVNGTAALHLALLALGIGPGDEVIVPALTFVASVNAIAYVGAKPVFVDIEPLTFNLDISKIESLISKKTKAIMSVDLYGHPVDFAAIKALSRKHKLHFISDSAESLGSLYQGKPTGSQADISTFSFFGNKIITTGEGGAITTNSKKLYDTMKLYRDQGKYQVPHMYYHSVVGYNYAMTNLQAAVGIGQLSQIKKFVAAKRKIATRYIAKLKNIPGISFQTEANYAQSNYWMFSILVDNRDQLMAFLKSANIETRPFFYPMPKLPIYKHNDFVKKFPVTQNIADRGMNLPTFASLSNSEQDYIVQRIADFITRTT